MKRYNVLVVDSDGCVFNTMEIKQKQCFHPLIIEHWQLHEISETVKQCAEFVTLYSRWRGTNRFIALVKIFEILSEYPLVLSLKIEIPRLCSLKDYIASGKSLDENSIQKFASERDDDELLSVVEWSKKVNLCIRNKFKNPQPFNWAVKCLKFINDKCDIICVSQTPYEALLREWKGAGLLNFLKYIFSQEHGSKSKHLEYILSTYDRANILMIGDSIGDKKAADEHNVLFYPVLPGKEEYSWQILYEKFLDRFLSGELSVYDYKDLLIEFDKLLSRDYTLKDL